MLPTAAPRCYPWECFENCGQNLGINGLIQITKTIFSDKYGCHLHNFSKLLTYIVWTCRYKFPHSFINNIWILHTHYAPVSEIIHFLQISSCSIDISAHLQLQPWHVSSVFTCLVHKPLVTNIAFEASVPTWILFIQLGKITMYCKYRCQGNPHYINIKSSWNHHIIGSSGGQLTLPTHISVTETL